MPCILPYSRIMTRLPKPLRRSLAALAAMSVLLAPATQTAHALAMLHEAVATCSQTPGHHHMAPMSAPHGSRHQHGATCCDLCPAGCQTVALAPSVAGLPAIIGSYAFAPVAARRESAPRRAQHFLPFSLAPPASSV